MDEKPVDLRFEFSRRATAQLEEFGLDGADVIRAVALAILKQISGNPHYSTAASPVAIGELPDGGRVKVNFENKEAATFIINRIEYWRPRTASGSDSRLA